MPYFDDADNRRFFFLAFYCSFVWFVTRTSLPFGSFQNIPIYLPLTLASFFYLPTRAAFWAIGFTIFLLFFETLKLVQPGLDISARGYLSVIAIGLIVPSCGFSLLELLHFPEERVLQWLRATLYLFGFSQFMEILLVAADLVFNPYVHYFLPFLHRYSGTLEEPSHLAPVLAPLIFILINYPRYFVMKLGRGGTLAFCWIVFMGLSSTLFVVVLSAAAVLLARRVLRLEIGIGILIGVGVVAIIGAFLAIPAFSTRLLQVLTPSTTVDLSVSEALSVLVLIKGYEMTSYAMAHFPLGVHALNMQMLAPFSRISSISDFMFAANSNDGASLLFKGVCEYGYLWIVMAIAALVNLIIRAARMTTGSFADLLKLGFLFALFGTFIRGTSYYHNVAPFTLALTLFSLCSVIRSAAKKKVNLPEFET